jgi:uncharacterized protein (TIGR00290 family)
MTVARPKALVSWSSGKDSAFALWETLRQGEFEVVGLLTTLTAEYERVAMHGVRESILDQQFRAAGISGRKVYIPSPCPNEVYEQKMSQAMHAAKAEGILHVIFGDLFLEDIRSYRETKLAQLGINAVFPLWGRDTRELAADMISSGLRATLSCIDPRKLDKSFAGRSFDAELLSDLPASIDPCGENGEFHTVVTAGPPFAHPIETRVGEVVERDGFVFADVLNAD